MFCSIAAFFEQIRFGKAIYLLPVPIGSCLASQHSRRVRARDDSMPPCCIATGCWGAVRRRPDTGIAEGPCPLPPAPCPLPGLIKNRQVDMTKIKPLLQKGQTSLYPGCELLDTNCCTMISLKHIHIFMYLEEKAT